MDMANKKGGLLIGTGDMSELALGWATYNGDHMSMYGVNCSVPKTLVRHLVRYYADTCGDEETKAILLDVLDTPVSPELLPPKDGVISQKTEDLVGPYELHDFFLYYLMRFGYASGKALPCGTVCVFRRVRRPDNQKWLKTFYCRFLCPAVQALPVLPDGPKVGSVALSPRGDLRMPSDACARSGSRSCPLLMCKTCISQIKSTVVREKEALMTVFFCFRGSVFLPFVTVVMADRTC